MTDAELDKLSLPPAYLCPMASSPAPLPIDGTGPNFGVIDGLELTPPSMLFHRATAAAKMASTAAKLAAAVPLYPSIVAETAAAATGVDLDGDPAVVVPAECSRSALHRA